VLYNNSKPQDEVRKGTSLSSEPACAPTWLSVIRDITSHDCDTHAPILCFSPHSALMGVAQRASLHYFFLVFSCFCILKFIIGRLLYIQVPTCMYVHSYLEPFLVVRKILKE